MLPLSRPRYERDPTVSPLDPRFVARFDAPRASMMTMCSSEATTSTTITTRPTESKKESTDLTMLWEGDEEKETPFQMQYERRMNGD